MRSDDESAFPDALEQLDPTHVRWKGRRLVYFGGCDYLRLSFDPEVRKAVVDGLRHHGLNVSASRKTTGNHRCYELLETELRRFFASKAALVAPTGYAANLIVAQALRGSISHLFIDDQAHPSLRDAAEMTGATVHVFNHLDASSLNEVSGSLPKGATTALLTDGLFAHNGSVAPLAQYRKILPNALFWVDDAHAAGVLGKNGRGTVEAARLNRENLIQTITLSKAFGVYGGAVIADKPFISDCISKSRLFAGSTPLPLPLATAAVAALKEARSGKLRARLSGNISYFYKHFAHLGDGSSSTPILAICPGNPGQQKRIHRSLLQHGIFPSFIHYPGGPARGFFRFAISSAHAPGQLDSLGAALSI